MKKNKVRKPGNVFELDKIRAKKKPTIMQLLRDRKKATMAIATRTCLLCNTKKACVNKTGVCASCYDNVLTPDEKIVADKEARHKVIKILVCDDRDGEERF